MTGIGTAEALAKVYGMLANGGVAADGRNLISENLLQTLNDGMTPLLKDEVLGIQSRFSYGFSRLQYQVR